MSNFVGKRPNPLAAAVQGITKFIKGGKKSDPGAAIKSIPTNVPTTKLEKLKASNVIGGGRLKGAQAKLKQTMFEIKNPQFSGGRLTFSKDKKKSESNKEAYKRIQKENTETIKKFIAPKDFAKGGRVEYKKGTPNPFARKSKLKKIQEAFKVTPSFMTVKKEKPKKRLMAKKGSPDPKKKKKFPDLTGDGKVTFADILKGRGVIKGKKKKTKKKII